jgi:predicted ABC-type ATPase
MASATVSRSNWALFEVAVFDLGRRGCLRLSWPNGAGKTTFAKALLRTLSDFAYLNADEIKKREDCGDIRAGRRLLQELTLHLQEGENVALETTLSGLTYGRAIPAWQQSGYRVSLYYIRQANAEMSVERVRRRVEAGGHDISADLHQRFARSLANLELFKPLVDHWYVFDSHEGEFKPAEAST